MLRCAENACYKFMFQVFRMFHRYVFTPKLGTFTLDREESADGDKSNKYLQTSQEILFNIFGDMFGNT